MHILVVLIFFLVCKYFIYDFILYFGYDSNNLKPLQYKESRYNRMIVRDACHFHSVDV